MTQDEQPGLRITVTAGSPTDEDIAALTAVVTGIAAQQGPTSTAQPPAWSQASRLEALGQAPVSSAADPRLRR